MVDKITVAAGEQFEDTRGDSVRRWRRGNSTATGDIRLEGYKSPRVEWEASYILGVEDCEALVGKTISQVRLVDDELTLLFADGKALSVGLEHCRLDGSLVVTLGEPPLTRERVEELTAKVRGLIGGGNLAAFEAWASDLTPQELDAVGGIVTVAAEEVVRSVAGLLGRKEGD